MGVQEAAGAGELACSGGRVPRAALEAGLADTRSQAPPAPLRQEPPSATGPPPVIILSWFSLYLLRKGLVKSQHSDSFLISSSGYSKRLYNKRVECQGAGLPGCETQLCHCGRPGRNQLSSLVTFPQLDLAHSNRGSMKKRFNTGSRRFSY